MTSLTPDNGAYLRALYDSLETDGTSVRDADPLTVLSHAVEGARAVVGDDVRGRALIEALAEVGAAGSIDAAIVAAGGRFESGPAFVEAVYAARCIEREGSGAVSLLGARAYVDAAYVPASIVDLSTDRTAVLDATSFYALWREPGRAGWMLDVLARWRRDYTSMYASRHAVHRAQMQSIVDGLEASRPAAAAVARLDGLAALGEPLGAEDLAELGSLQSLTACGVSGVELAEALRESPLCPSCGYKVGDEAPVAQSKRVRGEIDRALAGQQTRLARHVISRLLARPSQDETQRLRRFIEVVRASDLTGLALVLDDELVSFIGTLLQAESPAPASVLTQLAAAYPEVSAGNLDAAVNELRRLLSEELARGGMVRLQADSTT